MVKTKLQLAEAMAAALQEYKSDVIQFGTFNKLADSILLEYKDAERDKNKKTVGQVIDADAAWIIKTAERDAKDGSLLFLGKEYGKADKIASFFLHDHRMKMYIAERVIEKVSEHFNLKK